MPDRDPGRLAEKLAESIVMRCERRFGAARIWLYWLDAPRGCEDFAARKRTELLCEISFATFPHGQV